MKNIISLVVITFSTIGCVNYNILPTFDSDDVLRKKNGGFVKDCNDSVLFINSPNTDYFWNFYNLPKGTTEFVCKNGKAYLPDQVPRN